MYARVTTMNGSADSVDAGLDDVKGNILPALRQVPGSAGIMTLTDRTTGRTIGITLWESEAAMRSSEEAADAMRKGTAEAGGSQIASVERFEIALDERW
jgi:hypothetical protein